MYGARRHERRESKSWRVQVLLSNTRTYPYIRCRGDVDAKAGAPRRYDPTRQCCKKKHCYRAFEEETVQHMRSLVYQGRPSVDEFRRRVKEAHLNYLLVDGYPCCVKFLTNVLGCSKDKLYYDRSQRVRIDRKAKGEIDTIAWFHEILPVLDAIPNPDNPQVPEEYQIHVPRKKDVYNMYTADAELWPDIYSYICQQYFLKLWRKHFPQVKCRRYLRFPRCDVCVRQRAIKFSGQASASEKKIATDTLLKHFDDIKLERAWSLANKNKALKEPDKYLWIAQDATDQLCYGLPHFMELADEKKERMRTHLMIDYVAGHEVIIWNHYDNLPRCPNVTIECLHRTLKRIEMNMGGLPETLFLQFDNCWRENRNNALFCHLAMLVERRVFTTIYVSFLPKGHTHNEPDQVAGRCSVACRCHDIPTRSHLRAVLGDCYAPRWGESVYVGDLDVVADIKGCYNPGGTQQWAGQPWKCMNGIGSSQICHFRFSKNVHGKVICCDKPDCKSPWSQPWVCFRRPPAAEYDLSKVGPCRYRTYTDDEREKISAGVASCKKRMLDAHYSQCLADLAHYLDPVEAPFHWENNGLFDCELRLANLPPEEAECEKEVMVEMLRESALCASQVALQERRRSKRVLNLTVGVLVAVRMDYPEDSTIPQGQRQRFWVGKVLEMLHVDSAVRVHWYVSNKEFGAYRPWTKKDNKFADICLESILAVFNVLNRKSRTIPAKTRSAINGAIEDPNYSPFTAFQNIDPNCDIIPEEEERENFLEEIKNDSKQEDS